MRFPIKISGLLRPLFRIFGFRADDSYIELEADSLHVRFGTADERIPLDNIDRVENRKWPIIFGLGAKLDTNDGVAYVGSRDGCLRIWLKRPQPMNVWGPFARDAAKTVTLSLQDPDGFRLALADVQG